jgi:acyl-CoA synthetase (NDP forming)
VTQSGGLGLALAGQLSRLGIGISSFASVGSKLDVSGDDLLLWWEQDGITQLAILYTESFGNPRKFARTARRVAATMPVLTIQAEAAGLPAVGRQALFEQAGIIATPGLGELTEITALLATQPVPRGHTVAIVSNVGAAGKLAADACISRGLTVHRPHGITRRRLHALAPDGGSVTGPVTMTSTVSCGAFRECLELLSAEEDVNAIIALVQPTAATGDLTMAIQQADVQVPLAAVVPSQAESVRLLDGTGGRRIPAYNCPEAAARALARAAIYGDWRALPTAEVPAFTDVAAGSARMLVHCFLTQAPGGGWLPPGEVMALLSCYGITPVPVITGPASDRATTEADRPAGPEVRVTVTDDPMFSPLIALGPGGAAAGPADGAARLAPLTTADADRLIGSSRAAPLLRGSPGAPVGMEALRDLLLRVSRLAEDLPEIRELRLDPVIVSPDGAFVADARIKATPCRPQDPLLRRPAPTGTLRPGLRTRGPGPGGGW